MSSAINSAIVTHWQGDATLADVTGPFNGVAPERTAYPYGVYDDRGGRLRLYFDGTYLKPKLMTLSIFHTDIETLGTLQTALHSRFDMATMAVTGSIHLSTVRVDDAIIPAGTSRDGSGKQVWKAYSIYRITVQDSF